MLRHIITSIQNLRLSGTGTSISRNYSVSFKDKWPEKIRQLEHKNPVRSKGRPELFVGDHHYAKNSFGEFRQHRKEFGNENHFNIDRKRDESDDNYIRLAREHRGPSSLHTYESKIERFSKQGRMAEAQEYFDKVVNEYRFKPTSFMYANLVKGYAKQGDMHMCFKLYNKMKKMKLREKGSHIYTSLFEVCAHNAGDREKSLEAATHLLGVIRHKSIPLAPTTYKAAVKAFGMLGDVETAFQLADECPADGKRDDYMLSGLLIACNSHKESGFQLAVSVFRSMRKRQKIPLTTKQHNLLLRTLDMGSGDLSQFKQLIQHQVSKDMLGIEGPCILPLISPGHAEPGLVSSVEATTDGFDATKDDVELIFSGVQLADAGANALSQAAMTSTLPDILDPRFKLPTEFEIKSLGSAQERLLLIGGVSGVIGRMVKQGCKPNIVTFFYLLRALPNYKHYEEKLLDVMKEHNVSPDAHFYAHIMARMYGRKCLDEMFELYERTCEEGLETHPQTYLLLSNACTTFQRCQRLLTDMKSRQLQPDLLLMKRLLLNAGSTQVDLLTLLLEEMDRCSVRPDDEFLSILKNKFYTGKSRLVAQEKNPEEEPQVIIDAEAMGRYNSFYRQWMVKARREADDIPLTKLAHRH